MRKKVIIIISIIILTSILLFFVSQILPLGYYKEQIIYDTTNGSQTIELGIPKLSFMKKENDKSYSYKNVRGNKVLTKEVKEFLNTLEPIECNDTTYYYNSENDFTIIDYSVKNHYIYNTISYRVVDGDYCYNNKLGEYSKKLGGIKRYHTLNGGTISLYENWDTKLEVLFLDEVKDDSSSKYDFRATLKVRLYERVTDKSYNTITLEESIGDIDIKDNKLYFYRKDIKQDDNVNLEIPKESVFEIKDEKLILIDNYLRDYYSDEIILK